MDTKKLSKLLKKVSQMANWSTRFIRVQHQKIWYTAQRLGPSLYRIDIKLYDIYDFDPTGDYNLKPKDKVVDLANLAESLGIIKNFETTIETHEILQIPD